MKPLRERYTPTDVGPVPAEWAAPRLQDVAQLITNGFVGTASPFYVDEGGVPYLYGTNVRPNRIDLTGLRLISKDFHEREAKTALKAGDVLMVQSGHIGTTAVVPPELEGANCHALILTRPKPDELDSDFLAYYLNSHIGKARLRGLEVGSTILHINTKDLKKFRIPLPDIREQRSIASSIKLWDSAIDVCSRLVDASLQQKKAVAQQLLTGKRRLPGFNCNDLFTQTSVGALPADWDVVTIGKIATEVSDRNADNEILPVLACSKHVGFVNSLEYFKKKVYSDDLANYKVIRRGQFGFPSNHIEEGSIGLQNICDAGVVSPIYTVFKTDESQVDAGFLFKLLKTEHYRQRFAAATNASVDRRGSLRWKGFKAIRIPLPSLREQQAIAAALDQATQLEEGYRQQREKLELEKRALMQQFLTGKRRVKLPPEEVATTDEAVS